MSKIPVPSLQRKYPFVLVLLLLCVSSSAVLAQAIVAPSARTLFHRGTLIRSFTGIEHRSLRTNGQLVDITQYTTRLALVYGFYPKWTVIAVQPYVSLDVNEGIGSGRPRASFNGLSDAQFFVQYDGLYSRNSPGGLTRLSGVLGLRLPTGADRLSTGAPGYTGGLIFEKAVNLKYVLTADIQYTLATEDKRGVKRGSIARFDVAPAYFLISEGEASSDAGWFRKIYDRVFRHGAYLMLEFNGTWQDSARSRGNEIANTGGTILSISPGIQYFPSDRFLVELSVPIPVIKSLNGVQPEPESSFLFGFRFLF